MTGRAYTQPGAPAPDVLTLLMPDVDWTKVTAAVRRLQQRIAKAWMEGKQGKARALQWLLTHSWYGKLLAVRRVLTNKGGHTPGIDGVRWRTTDAVRQALASLRRRGYTPQPLRRIYIPKKNGKRRPLGIPTMRDRAMQALYTLALTPIAETTADANSYGFRESRSTRDALQMAYICLARRTAPRWILEGDIRACFDEIAHEWLLQHIPMDQALLRKFLKAGYCERHVLHPTHAGTPQGGILSPVLANMTLDGLEGALKGHRRSLPVHLIRYADDFLGLCRDRQALETEYLPLIRDFLHERGLILSPEKTVITEITDGFDFLGQHVRKYGKREKFLITPARKNVQAFLTGIRQWIGKHLHVPQEALIHQLNEKVQGWANFHSRCAASDAYAHVDYAIYQALLRWAKRRHPEKSASWRYRRYFLNTDVRGVFATPKDQQGKQVVLRRAARTPIVRHIKIRKAANPYDPADAAYFAHRRKDPTSYRPWDDTART